MDQTHHSICSLCEAMCGLRVTVRDGAVVDLRGDPDDPLSAGHICPKAAALPDIHTDPDRLRHPVKRVGDGWERVSWDEALDDIAARIHHLQQTHGRGAVGSYLGNPNVHNLGSMLYLPNLLKTLRTPNRFSATSVDQLPHMFAAFQMFGHQLLLPIPDLDRTDLLVIFGANPVASNGSLMSAPGIQRRLKAIGARGKVVVFDPRRTETAELAHTHHFVRPGTDALLLLGLLHEALRLADPARLGHLADQTDGVDTLREVARDFPPERVAPLTGVSTETIRDLAEALLKTPRAAVYGRIGVSVQAYGGLCAWLIVALNAVTGHLDTEGGYMFTQPALDSLYPPGGRNDVGWGHFDRWRSRVRGLPEFNGELPVSTLAEEIETPGEGQIRGMLIWAGNPVLSTPNGQRLDEALASLELLVSVDLYLNETARHAHYVLPSVPPLSRPHYDAAFHLLAVRNTARFAPPILPVEGDLQHDWQIAMGLKQRIEAARGVGLRKRLSTWMLGRLGPERLLDLGLRLGPRGGRGGLSLRTLRAQPSGVDLGALAPCLLQRLPPGQRIDLAPALLVADVRRLTESLDTPPAPLVLIGRRSLRSNNSWMHNHRRLVKGPNRCTLLVHPEDAAAHGLVDGAEASVRSRVGEVRVPAEVTDSVMPGVVCLPHGYGHDRAGTRLTIARTVAGVSANDLTDDQVVEAVTGNAVLNGVPVQIGPV